MHYKKAPILEAVLEFGWTQSRSMDELKAVLTSAAFRDFGDPKPRVQIDARVDMDANAFSHQQRQVGFQSALRDGSETVFLEEQKFVFVRSAPYDCWEDFSTRALQLLAATVSAFNIHEFSRVGTRFVNRIDIPDDDESGSDTDKYVTIKFDGPRQDIGIIDEFQMRVVKPTKNEGIHYALVLATTPPPLPNHSAILLDIDVFTLQAVPTTGEKLMDLLGEMRVEKNDIFEKCITDKSRELFGGVEK